MVQDLGGARYPIEVVDAFSKPLDDLKRQLAEIQAQFESLRSTGAPFANLRKQSQDSTKEARAQAKEVLDLNKKDFQARRVLQEQAGKETIQLARQNYRAYRLDLTAAQREQLALAKQNFRARTIAQRDAQQEQLSLAQLNFRARTIQQKQESAAFAKAQKEATAIEQQRVKDFAEARKAEATAFAQSPQGRSKADVEKDFAQLQKFQTTIANAKAGVATLPKTLRDAEEGVRRLTGQMTTSSKAGNSLLFTFRRLFGVLAAFTLVRKIGQAIGDVFEEALRFNAELETSRIAIASLIVSVGNIRRPTGEAAEGAEAIGLAMKEARRQTDLLRLESFKASASLKELSDAFTVALSPGLRAGLSLDQIRKLSIEISQAAAAIGVPQQQLAEEIRSLLEGTISVRQTRIATALGITPEDVRRAKELGTFAQFLEQKFAGISDAAQEGLNTFDRILANLHKSFDIVLGQASLGFFTTLKESLKEVSGFLTTGKGEFLKVDPSLVSVLGLAFDVLQQTLRVNVEVFKDPALRNFFQLIGDTADAFRTLLPTLGSFFSGIVNQVLGPLQFLGLIPQQFFDAFKKGITELRISFVDVIGFLEEKFVVLREKFLSIFGQGEGEDALTARIQKIRDATNEAVKAIRAEGAAPQIGVNLFEGLPAVLGGARKELEEQGNTVRELDDEFKNVTAETDNILKNLKAQGAVLQQNEEILRGEQELRTKGKELAVQQKQEEAKVSGILSAQLGVQRRINALSLEDRTKVAERVGLIRSASNQEAAIERLKRSSLRLEEQIVQAREAGQPVLAQSLTLAREIVEADIATLQGSLDKFKASQDTTAATEEQAKAEKELNELAQQTVVLEGERVAAKENQIEITKDQARLEAGIFKIVSEKIRAQAAQETQRLIETNRELRAQLASEREILATRRSLLETFQDESLDKQLARAKGTLIVEKERFQTAIEANRASLEAAQRNAKDIRLAPDARAELEREVLALKDQQNVLTKEQEQKLRDIEETIRRINQAQAAGPRGINELAKATSEAQDLVERGDDWQKALRRAKKELQEIVLITQSEARSIRESTLASLAQLAAEEEIRSTRRSILETLTNDRLDIQLAQTKAILVVEQARLATAIADNKAKIADTKKVLADPRRAEQRTLEETKELQRQITALEDEQVVLTQEQTEHLRDIREKLEELEKASQSFGAALSLGFKKALADFAAAAPDTFQTAFNAMTTALNGIVDIGREAFASIFDPNSNFSIKEALGRLALDIASNLFADALKALIAGLITTQATTEDAALIAAQTLQLGGVAAGDAMIAAAITASGILAGGGIAGSIGGSAGTPIGFFERGGRVPQPQYRARGGFAMHPGGPRGRDTVPLWAEPDEFIVRAREARRVPVLRVLDAINQGRVPDGVLNAVASSTRAMRTAPVAPRSAVVHAASGGSIGRSTGGGTNVLPVAVVDPKTMDLILTQGEGQLMRWLADRGVPIGTR